MKKSYLNGARRLLIVVIVVVGATLACQSGEEGGPNKTFEAPRATVPVPTSGNSGLETPPATLTSVSRPTSTPRPTVILNPVATPQRQSFRLQINMYRDCTEILYPRDDEFFSVRVLEGTTLLYDGTSWETRTGLLDHLKFVVHVELEGVTRHAYTQEIDLGEEVVEHEDVPGAFRRSDIFANAQTVAGRLADRCSAPSVSSPLTQRFFAHDFTLAIDVRPECQLTEEVYAGVIPEGTLFNWKSVDSDDAGLVTALEYDVRTEALSLGKHDFKMFVTLGDPIVDQEDIPKGLRELGIIDEAQALLARVQQVCSSS